MSSGGSLQMIFLSMQTCTIGSQFGPNKMAAASFSLASLSKQYKLDQWFKLTRLPS